METGSIKDTQFKYKSTIIGDPDTYTLASIKQLLIEDPKTIFFHISKELAGILKIGGPQVVLFTIISSIIAICQNVVGIAIAPLFGLPPLFGVLSGSVTLTGGPATGLAFAPLFENAGVVGAATIAVAAGMTGIISGGLIGGPVGTYLITKFNLRSKNNFSSSQINVTAENIIEPHISLNQKSSPKGEDKETYWLLKNLVVILFAMWVGGLISDWFKSIGWILPPYIGAMLIASLIRNIDDATNWIGLSQDVIDDIGNAALSLFLVMALMTLKLWELSGLVLPLIVIMFFQIILILVVSVFVIYKFMGKDYEAAVMSSGFVGFMLGTTANAMANMRVLVDKYGPAYRAFLVIPMVGAFFIDFINALLITFCLNFLK
ncbi:MAG: sodium/glutamate symporter [Bacteroidetes bacterium]|nr:sodium/glutamate symporter [Bacteroidota bacterium]